MFLCGCAVVPMSKGWRPLAKWYRLVLTTGPMWQHEVYILAEMPQLALVDIWF